MPVELFGAGATPSATYGTPDPSIQVALADRRSNLNLDALKGEVAWRSAAKWHSRAHAHAMTGLMVAYAIVRLVSAPFIVIARRIGGRPTRMRDLLRGNVGVLRWAVSPKRWPNQASVIQSSRPVYGLPRRARRRGTRIPPSVRNRPAPPGRGGRAGRRTSVTIVSLRGPPWLPRACRSWVTPSFEPVFDPLFDRRASRRAEPVSVFHGFLAYSLYSLRRYRALGAQIVLDTGAADIELERDLVLREYQRWGIRRNAMRPAWVARQVNEYHGADVILVPSTFVADTLKARGIPGERLFLLPYGVDIDRFPFLPPRSQGGKLRVIFVGGITLEKGDRVPARGDRGACGSSNTYTRRTGISGRRARDAALLRKYYTVTYPTFPLLVERHTCGARSACSSVDSGWERNGRDGGYGVRPAGLSDYVGAKDFLGNGGGVVVRHASAEALQQGLEWFLLRRSAIAAMGGEARDAVLGWTWQDYGARLCTLYEQLALASAHGAAGTGSSEASVEDSAALFPPLRT